MASVKLNPSVSVIAEKSGSIGQLLFSARLNIKIA
jgi:hypothetical protein